MNSSEDTQCGNIENREQSLYKNIRGVVVKQGREFGDEDSSHNRSGSLEVPKLMGIAHRIAAFVINHPLATESTGEEKITVSVSPVNKLVIISVEQTNGRVFSIDVPLAEITTRDVTEPCVLYCLWPQIQQTRADLAKVLGLLATTTSR